MSSRIATRCNITQDIQFDEAGHYHPEPKMETEQVLRVITQFGAQIISICPGGGRRNLFDEHILKHFKMEESSLQFSWEYI